MLSLLCHLSINPLQSVHVARIVLVLAVNNGQFRKAKFTIVVIQVFATLRSRRKNKLRPVRMYRKTDEETMYYSIGTKLLIRTVIAIAKNCEVFCLLLP